MNLIIVSTICVLLVASSTTIAALEEQTFQQCFEKDSISCIQLAIFRQAKSFFDKPKIDLFAGLSLTKNAEGRSGKSIEDNSISVETAKSVEDRNNQMESYFISNAMNFFQERSLSINFASAARSVANAIPDNIKSDIRDLVVEGRTKKKLLLKKLLPILIAIKFKVLLLFGTLLGLLLISVKALIVSIIALGLAAFTGIRSIIHGGAGGGGIGGGGGGGILSHLGSLFHGGSSNNAGSGGFAGPGAGWSSGGAGGWSGGGGGGGWGAGGGGGGWNGGSGWDSHGSFSAPIAQTLAYSGQKPTTR